MKESKQKDDYKEFQKELEKYSFESYKIEIREDKEKEILEKKRKTPSDKEILVDNETLRKKYYMKFDKKLIKEGKILPIYEDWKTHEKLLGYAKLNTRLSIDEEELPYERVSIGTGINKEQDIVIFKHQRWNITYVDPLEYNDKMSQEERWKYIGMKNFTTNWNIAYFEAVDANYISGM